MYSRTKVLGFPLYAQVGITVLLVNFAKTDFRGKSGVFKLFTKRYKINTPIIKQLNF